MEQEKKKKQWFWSEGTSVVIFFSTPIFIKQFYCGGLGHVDNKTINILDHSRSDKAFAVGILSYSL